MAFLPEIPNPLAEIGAKALQWAELIGHIAGRAQSPLGRAWASALAPSGDAAWIEQQQQRNAEMQRLIVGGSFDFHGILDVTEMLDKARIEGAALEGLELRAVMAHAERVEAWRQRFTASADGVRDQWPGIEALSAPLLPYDLGELLRFLGGKIEPDGSLSDHASHELARIRRSKLA